MTPTHMPSIDDALARLAQIRAEIEGHANAIWILEREADELRAQVRIHHAKPLPARPIEAAV
jgi:uncharacterized protein Yka (UPF0111/DUF47 family)